MVLSYRSLRSRLFPLVLVAIGLVVFTPVARALRVVNYNILNYPGTSGTARAPYYRTVLSLVNADVLVTEEISSPSGPTQFLNEVLNVLEPGQWATVPFIDGNDTDASLFYKPAKVQFLGQGAFYPNSANQLRYVHTYRLLPVGYSSGAAVLRLYTAHLKASTGFEPQRLAECTGIRDSMNTMPAGTRALITGDMNFYTQAAEPGYAKLLESQANNTGRVYDMLAGGAWHDGAAFAPIHTQSTCLNGTCASGAATGGMDDRFDFVLPSVTLGTGQGLSVIPGSCAAVGNDGLHLNKNITDLPVIPEGAEYATALKLTSDHLPVRVDLQLPAMLMVDPSLAFTPVIVGAPAPVANLGLNNPAVPPADSANCSFAAPAGFGGPAPVAIAAGGAVLVPVTMNTSTSGLKAGTLVVSSDAPDDPSTPVDLSGTVLDHAAASLDSTAVVLASTVDFGDHGSGAFVDQPVRVFNTGYDALQARLLVSSGIITGGHDRFTLVGGFSSQLIGQAGHGFDVAFDDAGATLDSTYTATLVFTSSDEPLPGATAQPDLVVSLRARVTSGIDTTNEPAAPTATRLFPPYPNPLLGHTTMRLDVARAIHADLSVFDPSGRRVARLRQGSFAAGRHAVSWDGRNDNGTPVGSGIYFVRFDADGLPTQVARVAIVR